MSTRVNPLANLAEPPVFTTKVKTEKSLQTEAIERIAEENNFPSRQAAKIPKEPKRKRRVYTTGRNRQFNIKATAETVERFYKMADERRVPLCEWLEQALDALDRAGGLVNGDEELETVGCTTLCCKAPTPQGPALLSLRGR
jgi:hypothetical protein